jgi:uncharacterized protein DUF6082
MRFTRRVAVALILAFTVAASVGSPLLLRLASRWSGMNWAQLSDVGQAYGAASAVFSSLAVVGVAWGLAYQARQTRLTRLHHVRAVQRELLLRIVDKPELAKIVGIDRLQEGIAPEHRAFIVTWLQYHYLWYESGLITEGNLTGEVFPDLFTNADARKFWAIASPYWHKFTDESVRSFARIADNALLKANREVSSSSTAILFENPQPRSVGRTATVVFGGVVVAIWLIHESRKDRDKPQAGIGPPPAALPRPRRRDPIGTGDLRPQD